MPEMVETNIVEGGGRLVARDMATQFRAFLVRPQHQRDRIPANQRADAVLHFLVARQRIFGMRGDGVDVGGVGGVGQVGARAARLLDQFLQQKVRPYRPLGLQHAFECGNPLPGFFRVYIVFKEAQAIHENLLCRR